MSIDQSNQRVFAAESFNYEVLAPIRDISKNVDDLRFRTIATIDRIVLQFARPQQTADILFSN